MRLRSRLPFPRSLMPALLALGFAAIAQAQTVSGDSVLLRTWRAVEQHDAGLAVARAQSQTGAAQRAQADALWRPTVGVTAGIGLINHSTAMTGAQFSTPGMGTINGADMATSLRGAGSARWAIQAQQPLFNPQKRAQAEQLNAASSMADAQWRWAQMQAMAQTAERVLQLALAERRVAILTQQQASVKRTAVEAKDRFDMGASPVTDKHEAEAALAAVDAQRIEAELQRRQRQQILSDSSGGALPSPTELAALLSQPAPALKTDTAVADTDHPLLQQREAALRQAEWALKKTEPMAQGTVDLVAQASGDHMSGSGAYGNASQRQLQQMVGVQLNWPLYTGGMLAAKAQEASAALTQAQAQLDETRQMLRQQRDQSAWAIDADRARLRASDQALIASAARLDATRVGRSVGDRTTQDVLNAENDHARLQLADAQARVSLRLHALQQRLWQGKLSEADL